MIRRIVTFHLRAKTLLRSPFVVFFPRCFARNISSPTKLLSMYILNSVIFRTISLPFNPPLFLSCFRVIGFQNKERIYEEKKYKNVFIFVLFYCSFTLFISILQKHSETNKYIAISARIFARGRNVYVPSRREIAKHVLTR